MAVKEVPGVHILYEGSQEDIARYFDGFCEAAERRMADDKYSVTERKLARREVYCWTEAARIVRATKLVVPKPVSKKRVKTVMPAPKEALHMEVGK